MGEETQTSRSTNLIPPLMSPSHELRVDNFDPLYHGFPSGFDFDHIDTGYMAGMSKHQFDTDHTSPYPTVPFFDNLLSNLSSGPSSFPSSFAHAPAGDDQESASVDGHLGSDADSDVEQFSLSDGKKFKIIGDVAYPASSTPDQDIPYVPPTSPTQAQALVRSQRRRRQKKVVTAPLHYSDEEADFESGGGDATEDEYAPTPPLNPLKRRRGPENPAQSSPSPSPSFSHYHSLNARAHPTKRQRNSKSSRFKRASRNNHNPEQWSTEDDRKWRCPHESCDHRQWNRRGPDFRRHQRTHTRASTTSPYICWGVRLEHAGVSRKPVPGPTDRKRGVAMEYQGVMRIGGCFDTFSRLDALKRHLEKTKKGKACATDYDDFRGVAND